MFSRIALVAVIAVAFFAGYYFPELNLFEKMGPGSAFQSCNFNGTYGHSYDDGSYDTGYDYSDDGQKD